MWFWILILICDIIIPAGMIIGGYLMHRHTPKKINGVYGYRTKLSMKNKETWEFAHHYCGRLWIKTGGITLVLSMLFHISVVGSSYDTIGMVSIVLVTIQIIILICSLIPIEKALKKNFDDKGKHL